MLQKDTKQIQLAIADDHIMVREGLCSLISQMGGFNVNIQADDGLELIDKLHKASILPDICILDVNMPKKNGWQTLSEIKKIWPTAKVLILTMLHESDIFANIAAGDANGYIPKNSSAIDLKNCLLKIHENGYFFHESISRFIYESTKRGKQFSKKEIEFLSHCCDDNSYKDIASKMCVSPRTVEGYRDSLFEKLNIKTRIGLAMFAIKSGYATML